MRKLLDAAPAAIDRHKLVRANARATEAELRPAPRSRPNSSRTYPAQAVVRREGTQQHVVRAGVDDRQRVARGQLAQPQRPNSGSAPVRDGQLVASDAGELGWHQGAVALPESGQLDSTVER